MSKEITFNEKKFELFKKALETQHETIREKMHREGEKGVDESIDVLLTELVDVAQQCWYAQSGPYSLAFDNDGEITVALGSVFAFGDKAQKEGVPDRFDQKQTVDLLADIVLELETLHTKTDVLEEIELMVVPTDGTESGNAGVGGI